MTMTQTNAPVVGRHVQNLILRGDSTQVHGSIANAHPDYMVGLASLLIVLGGLFAFYFLLCYCLKRICEKCGTEPGVLVWIPILNLVRMLQVAGLSGWLFFLFFIPVVNIVASIVMWAKICQARGKSAWLVLLLFIPLGNIAFLLLLAFSE